MGVYASVADVRGFSGVPSDKVGDDELELFIGWAEDFIDEYTGTTWKTKEAVEYFDGGRRVLYLSKYPVQSVTEIRVLASRTEGLDQDVVLGSDDYVLSSEGVLRLRSIPPRGLSNVKVTYVYGYGNVTGPVREACVLLASMLAKMSLRGKVNPYDLRRFVFGSETAEFAELGEWRERALQILDSLVVKGGVVPV